MEDRMLTTIDNPFDPFTEFDKWNAFDVQKGYNTNAYLARVAAYSHELSDAEIATSIEQAMQEIVEYNLTGNYLIVTREEAKTMKDRAKLQSSTT